MFHTVLSSNWSAHKQIGRNIRMVLKSGDTHFTKEYLKFWDRIYLRKIYFRKIQEFTVWKEVVNCWYASYRKLTLNEMPEFRCVHCPRRRCQQDIATWSVADISKHISVLENVLTKWTNVVIHCLHFRNSPHKGTLFENNQNNVD